MNNKYFKRALAFSLAAVMTFGSSISALAENPTNGSGSGVGTGTSNGHVEQKVVSVTLPTNVGTTFDYIADPEDLIGGTVAEDGTKGKTKTGDEVNPNTDYVYFHNAARDADADKDIAAQAEGYSSTSDTVRVINKSSVAINLTVSAKVTADDDNMAIADTAAELATATTTPTVHFDLLTTAKGGSAVTTAVTTTDGVSKGEKADIAIAGVAGNFELTQSGTGADGKYSYAVKSGVKDKDWNYVDIALKGACSKATTTDTLKAPKFEMTWSWTDPSATPSITLTAAGLATITNAPCTSAQLKSAEGISGTESYTLVGNDATLADPSNGTITIQMGPSWLSAWAGRTDVKIKVVFDDDTEVISNAVTFAE